MISGLEWPANTPFHVVKLHVNSQDGANGAREFMFQGETGGGSAISFDISSALRALWSGYDFSDEVQAANSAVNGQGEEHIYERSLRYYSLLASTEFIHDDGMFTTTHSREFNGGACTLGGSTEWERYKNIVGPDTSTLSSVTPSTKPTAIERVGVNSITSSMDWGSDGEQEQTYYSAAVTPAGYYRDESHDYADFLFVNRRGAVETCSGMILESESIEVSTSHYAKVGSPTFIPSRSLTAIASGGRRSWSMSSGYQTREWAEWWALEFLMAKQWWMRYPVGETTGTYVPVIVEPAKKESVIYDRTKQEMPSVEFTVTLAFEG